MVKSSSQNHERPPEEPLDLLSIFGWLVIEAAHNAQDGGKVSNQATTATKDALLKTIAKNQEEVLDSRRGPSLSSSGNAQTGKSFLRTIFP